MIPEPKAFLFDWDNTLVDTWPCIHEALSITFKEMGQVPWTYDEFKERLGPSMRDSFPGLFGGEWPRAGEIFHEAFAATHLVNLTVLPGAEDLIKGLFEVGYPLGVVSNKTGCHLRAEAEHLGWSAYFGGIVGAMDASEDKPNPAPVHLALEKSGIEAGRGVWFVGDALVDIQCAHNSGCFSVLVRAEEPEEEPFAQCPPDIHVTDCFALQSLLRQLSVPFRTD